MTLTGTILFKARDDISRWPRSLFDTDSRVGGMTGRWREMEGRAGVFFTTRKGGHNRHAREGCDGGERKEIIVVRGGKRDAQITSLGP